MPDLSQSSADTPPEGACFDFGGTAVSIASDSRSFDRLLEERYGAFLTDDRPHWRVKYEVTDPTIPSPDFLFAARQHSPDSRRNGDRLYLETPTFSIEIDRGSGRAQLAGPLATYPIDQLIQALFYESTERGLIIHAAALALGSRGFVMSGPSGSGKSTLAALFPELALCDEFVSVTLNDLSCRISALPFWRARSGSADLDGIYLLRHGTSNHRRRLASGEALDRLRREVVWPTFDTSLLRDAFETFFELVARVPIWELAFLPGREVWQMIECQEQE